MTLEEVEEMTRLAMRRLASSVCVVSSRDDETRQVMTATSVSSVSLEPPSLLVCVNKMTQLYPLLVARQPFAVNILGREQQEIAHVCGGDKQGDARFGVGLWDTHPDGPPVLLGAQANLICDTDAFLDYGSHGIFIGRIIDIMIGEDLHPLIYVDGEYTGISD
ncbi:MAG: flavin reductase [Alphaproteobacteria bacterium]|nr:MAG: flavin reductase [Alphaproteobacteria bacterium]